MVHNLYAIKCLDERLRGVKNMVFVIACNWSVFIRKRGGKKKERGLHVSGDVKLEMDRVHAYTREEIIISMS